MKPGSADRIDGLGPRLVPLVVTFLMVVLSVIPLEIPGYAAVTPFFVLMAVFHWTLYRPELLPRVAVFVIGLIEDLVAGGIVGVTPLVLLLVRSAVLDQRRFFAGRQFPFIWLGFMITAVLAILATWMIASVLNMRLLDPRSFAFRAVLTVAFYPVASWLFGWVQRGLMTAE